MNSERVQKLYFSDQIQSSQVKQLKVLNSDPDAFKITTSSDQFNNDNELASLIEQAVRIYSFSLFKSENYELNNATLTKFLQQKTPYQSILLEIDCLEMENPSSFFLDVYGYNDSNQLLLKAGCILTQLVI
jgi:hypothetical protein